MATDVSQQKKQVLKQRFLKLLAQLINVAMIVAAYAFIANNLLQLAIIVFALSKWRVIITKPRLWFLNVKNSLCDISFGLAIIYLMDIYYSVDYRVSLSLAAVLFIWQLIIKPLTNTWAVKLQGLLCIGAANTAIWTLYAQPENLYGFLAVSLCILAGYAAARHVLRQVNDEVIREEIRGKLLAVWVFVVAQVSWVFWLWNVSYNLRIAEVIVPQAAIVMSLLFSYVGSVLLYIQEEESETSGRKHLMQQTVSFSIIIVLILVLTDWNRSIQ